jgi:hypothetical protein
MFRSGVIRAYLVDEVLTMIVTQVLRPDHSVEIRLHQFLDEVHFFEAFEGGWLNDVQDCDNLGGRH